MWCHIHLCRTQIDIFSKIKNKQQKWCVFYFLVKFIKLFPNFRIFSNLLYFVRISSQGHAIYSTSLYMTFQVILSFTILLNAGFQTLEELYYKTWLHRWLEFQVLLFVVYILILILFYFLARTFRSRFIKELSGIYCPWDKENSSLVTIAFEFLFLQRQPSLIH